MLLKLYLLESQQDLKSKCVIVCIDLRNWCCSFCVASN